MIYRRLTAILVLLLSLALSVDAAQKKSFTLCIDAGHGGGDPGARGKISKEKTLTLRYDSMQLAKKNIEISIAQAGFTANGVTPESVGAQPKRKK